MQFERFDWLSGHGIFVKIISNGIRIIRTTTTTNKNLLFAFQLPPPRPLLLLLF